MSPLKQADRILFFIEKFLKTSAQISKEYVWNMYVQKTPENTINRLMFDEIMELLVEDGYVRKSANMQQQEQDFYHLTFKGRLFVQRGGYTKSHKRKAISATLQSVQAMAIVVATVLATIASTTLFVKDVKAADVSPALIYFGSYCGICGLIAGLIIQLLLFQVINRYKWDT